MANDQPESCPVCNVFSPVPFQEVDERRYWRCEICEARFLDPRQLPSAEEERTHYLHHENDVDDPRYRKFLSKLADPLLDKLEPGLSSLDYGCGPGPALAKMLEEAGRRMALYDPFFFPDDSALETTYDVITCTEVVEHFHRPFDEFSRLDRLLRPGGWLGIMTCFQTDDQRFATWHYRRDPTHVVFYRETTLRHIAAQRGWTCTIPGKDVALMQKPDVE
ncbi:MAG: class I SAM-dependent methyltransferase [Geminicoccaceae bacterium]